MIHRRQSHAIRSLIHNVEGGGRERGGRRAPFSATAAVVAAVVTHSGVASKPALGMRADGIIIVTTTSTYQPVVNVIRWANGAEQQFIIACILPLRALPPTGLRPRPPRLGGDDAAGGGAAKAAGRRACRARLSVSCPCHMYIIRNLSLSLYIYICTCANI